MSDVRRIGVAFAMVAIVASVVTLPMAAAADDNSDGTGITVTVRSGDQSPGSPSGGGPGAGDGSATPSPAPTTTTTPIPISDSFDLGGIFSISGLSSDYGLSANPFAGTATVRFTVRNTSSSTVDAAARFWLDGPFGNPIGRGELIAIDKLGAQETRTVSAQLTGVGQWTFVTGHIKFLPPREVAGTKLTPVTRDVFMFVPPWFSLITGVLGVTAYFVLRRFRMFRPTPVMGAAT